MMLLVTALTVWLLTKKLIVEPRRFLENKSILHILRGPGSPVEVAFDKEVLFSLQKVKKILEITPITSVCGPRRYSQAALADILGSTGSKGKLCFSICSVVETATAGELQLMKTLYFIAYL